LRLQNLKKSPNPDFHIKIWIAIPYFYMNLWISSPIFYGHRYFWRTYQGQEIDFIEEIENNFTAFEAKWAPTKKASVPSEWNKQYPQSTFHVISPDNYGAFVGISTKHNAS